VKEHRVSILQQHKSQDKLKTTKEIAHDLLSIDWSLNPDAKDKMENLVVEAAAMEWGPEITATFFPDKIVIRWNDVVKVLTKESTETYGGDVVLDPIERKKMGLVEVGQIGKPEIFKDDPIGKEILLK
jgi:hypothetical protein